MKNFCFLGLVINIVLFIVYVVVIMFIAGIVYGAISGGQTDMAIQEKIGYLSILVVLIITTIFRKVFYRPVWKEKKEVAITKKVESSKTKQKDKDGKMKIYVDKEIK